MVTTAQLQEYLRIPEDSTEDLELYLSAAKAKAGAAGVPEYSDNAQYDLFLLALASLYYDNRGMEYASGSGADAAAQRMINAFVLELRYQEAGDDE